MKPPLLAVSSIACGKSFVETSLYRGTQQVPDSKDEYPGISSKKKEANTHVPTPEKKRERRATNMTNNMLASL